MWGLSEVWQKEGKMKTKIKHRITWKDLQEAFAIVEKQEQEDMLKSHKMVNLIKKIVKP